MERTMKDINPATKERKPKSLIWQSRLVVNPDRGTIDRIMPSGKVREDVGCHTPKGYKVLNIKGKVYPVQHLIWKFMHGDWDDGLLIDHINGIKDDNKIENLRLVTPSQNLQNQHKPRRDNLSSGIKGVTLFKPTKKWHVRIRIGPKNHYLGQYDNLEDAAQAYANGAAKYHTHNPSASKATQ
jgi:hypothetical protein